jgi:hypothetical protein
LGGFAVDADFSDRFSGSIEDPKITKNQWKSIKFNKFSGGGSGPKHSAFCGACFSINPIGAIFGPISQKSDQNLLEPSTFFNAQIITFLIKMDPENWFFLFYRDPICQHKFYI